MTDAVAAVLISIGGCAIVVSAVDLEAENLLFFVRWKIICRLTRRRGLKT
jgi:hypothetical protein